jgi:acetyl-CoA carboxylase carboxyl transferase subunit alpha
MSNEDSQFEEPLNKIRRRIEELSGFPEDREKAHEIEKLREKLEKLSKEIFGALTPWQKTLVARHPQRPYTLDYIRALAPDFVELHGDRGFADDPAIVAGFGTFEGLPIAIVGHQKGRDTREKIRRNFGMPRPEGYRKALRLFRLAEKFGRPVVTFVDTPGAYPGIDAEERGQAEAIARNLPSMALLRTPIVVVVTGEGGSGGALAIGIGDRILMLEHAVYSVISPEGCAAILWKDPARARDAAEAMKLTAIDLAGLGVIDAILPEPPGGAHSNAAATIETVGKRLHLTLEELRTLPVEELVERRYQKFRRMGVFEQAE